MFFTSCKQVVVKFKSRVKGRKGKFSRRQPSPLTEGFCRQFSLAELQVSTNNFDHSLKIGEGAYGKAYKGFLNHGTSLVAIKRFNRLMLPGLGDEIQTEIQLLCQLRHQNLIALIGFCNEREEMILVYEYPNCGALACHLHSECPNPLSWKQRLEICIGAANGLHYLHTGAKQSIIHHNVKSSSILLNSNYAAQIGDLGFSKIVPHGMSKPKPKTKTKTCNVGSFSYMAPEYIINGELTEKCDVFSFGIVLFEVICGRLACEREIRTEKWICKCIKDGSIHGVIDPYLEGKIAPVSLIEFVEIAFSCIHPNPSERPSMGEVEMTLELALQLQEKADSVMEATNLHGRYTYEETQFHVSVRDYEKYLEE